MMKQPLTALLPRRPAALAAQISNLLYRGFPTRCRLERSERARNGEHSADWKSAILAPWSKGRLLPATDRRPHTPRGEQVGNLRYEVKALLWVVVLCLGSPTASQAGEGVLHTGEGDPFSSIGLTLDLRETGPETRLQFEFGFGTDEIEAPGTFFDSFSVTLQTTDGATTALLVTTDLLGPLWAPPTPGGLELSPDEIARQEIAFDTAHGNFVTAYAFAISLILPQAFAGQITEIFFDLFDNLNERQSAGYFNQLEIVPSALPPQISTLQSSASPGGPYADEELFEIDAEEQTIRLSLFAPKRFFRLRSDFETRINGFRLDGADLIIPYQFTSVWVTLQSAEEAEGPYEDVPGAVVDLETRTIVAPQDEAARFFRLNSNGTARIVSMSVENENVVLTFDFEPMQVTLQSSSRAAGPYADEQNVRVDRAAQVMRLPRSGAARYFRFAPGDSRRLTGLRIEGEQIVLKYAE